MAAATADATVGTARGASGKYSVAYLDHTFRPQYDAVGYLHRHKMEQGGPSPREVAALLVQPGETVEQAFVRLDINGDGMVSREELCAAGVREGVAIQTVAMADSDKDGRISLSEFYALCHVQSEVETLRAQLRVDICTTTADTADATHRDDVEASYASATEADAVADLSVPLQRAPSYQMAHWSGQQWDCLARDHSGFSTAPESYTSSRRGHERQSKTWTGVSKIVDLVKRSVAHYPNPQMAAAGSVQYKSATAEDFSFPRGVGMSFLEVIAQGTPKWIVCCSYMTEYELETSFSSEHRTTSLDVILVLDADGRVLDTIHYDAAASAASNSGEEASAGESDDYEPASMFGGGSDDY